VSEYVGDNELTPRTGNFLNLRPEQFVDPNNMTPEQRWAGEGTAARVLDVLAAPGRVAFQPFKDLYEVTNRAMQGENPLSPDMQRLAQSAVGGIGLESPLALRAQGPGAFAAWHGSGHRWEPQPGAPYGEFDPSKVSTGEGTQMEGWGLYSSRAQDASSNYETMGLDPHGVVSLDGKDFDYTQEQNFDPHVSSAIYHYNEFGGDVSKAAKALRDMHRMSVSDITNLALPEDRESARTLSEMFDKAADWLPANEHRLSWRPPVIDRNMYQLWIHPEHEEFLDWDKKFEEQQPGVQEKLRKVFSEPGIMPSNYTRLRSGAEDISDESLLSGPNSRRPFLQSALASYMDNNGDMTAALNQIRKGEGRFPLQDQMDRQDAANWLLKNRNYLTMVDPLEGKTGSDLYWDLSRSFSPDARSAHAGHRMGDPRQASEMLNDFGIPGNTYLDNSTEKLYRPWYLDGQEWISPEDINPYRDNSSLTYLHSPYYIQGLLQSANNSHVGIGTRQEILDYVKGNIAERIEKPLTGRWARMSVSDPLGENIPNPELEKEMLRGHLNWLDENEHRLTLGPNPKEIRNYVIFHPRHVSVIDRNGQNYGLEKVMENPFTGEPVTPEERKRSEWPK